MFIHLSFNWCLSYKSIVCNLNAYIFFRVHASYIFVFPFWKRPPFSGFVAQSPDDRVKVIITIQGKEWGVASSPLTILLGLRGGTSGWPQSPDNKICQIYEKISPFSRKLAAQLGWSDFWKKNLAFTQVKPNCCWTTIPKCLIFLLLFTWRRAFDNADC